MGNLAISALKERRKFLLVLENTQTCLVVQKHSHLLHMGPTHPALHAHCPVT